MPESASAKPGSVVRTLLWGAFICLLFCVLLFVLCYMVYFLVYVFVILLLCFFWDAFFSAPAPAAGFLPAPAPAAVGGKPEVDLLGPAPTVASLSLK